MGAVGDYLLFALLPQVVDGLIIGVALVMVALGLTLIFGLMRVINLAHGELYMMGAYLAFALVAAGAGFWSALLVSVLAVGVLGLGLHQFAVRPLMGRHDYAVLTLLLTYGVSLILQDAARAIWGVDTHRIAPPVEGVLKLGSVFLPNYRLLILVIGASLIAGAWALLYRTALGAVLRATAHDHDMVATLGVPVAWVQRATFFVACALAAVSGVLLAPVYAIFPNMGHDFLLMAFAIVIVGGMGSVVGTVVAGLALAQVYTLSSLWIKPVWAETLVFLVMILVLVFRPKGLFSGLGKA